MTRIPLLPMRVRLKSISMRNASCFSIPKAPRTSQSLQMKVGPPILLKQNLNISVLIESDPNMSKRDKRLLQNRRSALKCRMKKKVQFQSLSHNVTQLEKDNRDLIEKVSSDPLLPLSPTHSCSSSLTHPVYR